MIMGVGTPRKKMQTPIAVKYKEKLQYKNDSFVEMGI